MSDFAPVEVGPLIDNHCHGLVMNDLGRPAFEAMMNEADRPSAMGTSLFDSMLGLAVRRWCAPVLDLEPHASPDDYLARRQELGAAEVNRRLVREAGIGTFLVDTGLTPDLITTPNQLAGYCQGSSHEVVRLEAVGQQVLAEGVAPRAFVEQVRERLRGSGAVGAKSIAAYRVGLSLPARRPADDELVAALADVRPDATGTYRIAHPVVNGWLAWTAIELGMPLQF